MLFSLIRFFLPNLYSYAFWFLVILISGFAYKYDRKLFYRGPYEITYDSKELHGKTDLNNIGLDKSGLPIFGRQYRIYNSGHEKYPHFLFNIENHPALTAQFDDEVIYYACKKNQNNIPKPNITLTGNTGSTTISIDSLEPCAMVLVNLYSYQEMLPYEWENTHTSFTGYGSILEESPYKVALLTKLQNYFESLTKVFKLTRFTHKISELDNSENA